ncbi:MAG TPA: hypothetical protein VFJ57_05910 [Solirubrobacterales bacterium]|nr:hypothetical protein [Solirubrobacterales bacterium]
MIGRKSIIGIAVLCALAFSAFAAASASAEQRAYTCASGVGKKDYKEAHCVTNVGENNGTFGHTLITTAGTKITGTSANTASNTTAGTVSKLKGALSGVETEVQCTELTGTGELTNDNTEPGLSVSGTGTIVYKTCTVTKPAGKGCVVKGGSVTTEKLAATTVGQAANKVKFTPAGETNFAIIPIEKCEIAALNNNFPVTGSLVATASGATLTTTHTGITELNTLKFGGVKAGLEGALTIRMEGGEPITVT